ncbi:uracil-DNA glycosylase [Halobacillus sp. GSS1]|uniref:uracil-DNA glycosylase n=1 Tax=Halobacillus sp. GSS1 TaxID=2815919 RepID=UPI001A90B87F|nr:uracil-DNA glycosylase [Halobacillus sp. GSS1]MBN9656439.1 uracil-DNA glycosylase [Halobacillus sp. GSS1]
MEWPEHLVNEAKKRIEPYDVEGFVLGKGDDLGKVMIVGEAPGENEAVKGEPFIGRAGDELDKQLDYLGLSREDVYITSVVRSRPYKWVKTNKKGMGGKRKANRKPNQKEIYAHAKLLDYQIEQMKPAIIIALGGVAYERLTGDKGKISDVVGEAITTSIQKEEGGGYGMSEDEYTVVPLYHPAAVFYNPKIKEDIYRSLDQLKDYLKREGE